LYFNDDFILGTEVWPEDFITQAGGQKIYLAWWVPDCSEICSWEWVGDGLCDDACNTPLCEFDGDYKQSFYNNDTCKYIFAIKKSEKTVLINCRWRLPND